MRIAYVEDDMDGEIDFYTRALGLRLSDRSRGIVSFLRCSTEWG